MILAPLEGRSVITKERMYVNAKEEKDDQSESPLFLLTHLDSVYEKLMTDTKVSLDSFFVTEPPTRTKMPEREETTVVITTTEPTHLRLVTLPKLAKTTPPPFKYVSVGYYHFSAGNKILESTQRASHYSSGLSSSSTV